MMQFLFSFLLLILMCQIIFCAIANTMRIKLTVIITNNMDVIFDIM